MVYHSYHKYFSQSLLLAIYQYTNSLSLSDKQSVIVSVIISVHALGEQREREREREIKEALVLTRLHRLDH